MSDAITVVVYIYLLSNTIYVHVINCKLEA